VPHPVFLFGSGEGVEVDHRFPGRLVLAVLGQRRAPPEALGMLLVAPEIVEMVADLADHGNLRVGIEHLEDARVQRLEVLAFGVLGYGLGVFLLYPIEGLGPVDVLEPEVFVVRIRRRGGRGFRGVVCLGHATEGKGEGQRNPASVHRFRSWGRGGTMVGAAIAARSQRSNEAARQAPSPPWRLLQ